MCRRALTLAQVLGSDDVDDAVVAEPNRSEAETIEGIGSVGSGTAMATSTSVAPQPSSTPPLRRPTLPNRGRSPLLIPRRLSNLPSGDFPLSPTLGPRTPITPLTPHTVSPAVPVPRRLSELRSDFPFSPERRASQASPLPRRPSTPIPASPLTPSFLSGKRQSISAELAQFSAGPPSLPGTPQLAPRQPQRMGSGSPPPASSFAMAAIAQQRFCLPAALSRRLSDAILSPKGLTNPSSSSSNPVLY